MVLVLTNQTNTGFSFAYLTPVARHFSSKTKFLQTVNIATKFTYFQTL